jgi:hypothetical protein
MHACSENYLWEIIFYSFSSNFQFFFFFFVCVCVCEASGQWFCVSGRGRNFVQTFMIQVRTCALVRYLTWHYVRMALVIRPDNEPLRVKSHSPYAARLFHPFSLNFCQFMHFSLLFSRVLLTCICLFVISLHPRYVSLPFLLITFKFLCLK